MKFTESQKDFILSCLTTEITNKEILIKYWTDKAQKENNLKTKRVYNRSIEYCIKGIEELESLRDKINE